MLTVKIHCIALVFFFAASASVTGFNINGCATIAVSGDYFLTQNIVDAGTDCIIIEANNVVLDCGGRLVDGDTTATYGIKVERFGALETNVTIRNCTVTDWSTGGIFFFGADGNTVISCNATNNFAGFSFFDSDLNVVSNVYASGNEHGVNFHGYNNTVTSSRIHNNSYGVYLMGSENTVANSTIEGSRNNSIFIQDGEGNWIYNNMLNDSTQIGFQETPKVNLWNTTLSSATNIIGGVYAGGNYWTNPSGNGFSDTCADSQGDGICDNQHTIDSNNVDYLPLAPQGAPAATTTLAGTTTTTTTSTTTVPAATTSTSTTLPATTTLPGTCGQYTLSLTVGWNLISLPRNMC